MIQDNYCYRTDPLFLRNQFNKAGTYGIPIIPKASFTKEDFDDLQLIGFDKIKSNAGKHANRMVHFFLYDYKFERIWKESDADLEYLQRYRAVLTPDFSMYKKTQQTSKSSMGNTSSDVYRVTKYGYVEGRHPPNSTTPERGHRIVKYTGYVVQSEAGSAYGGNWRPSKPADERYLGRSGEIITLDLVDMILKRRLGLMAGR
jgi:hypothetical protein